MATLSAFVFLQTNSTLFRYFGTLTHPAPLGHADLFLPAYHRCPRGFERIAVVIAGFGLHCLVGTSIGIRDVGVVHFEVLELALEGGCAFLQSGTYFFRASVRHLHRAGRVAVSIGGRMSVTADGYFPLSTFHTVRRLKRLHADSEKDGKQQPRRNIQFVHDPFQRAEEVRLDGKTIVRYRVAASSFGMGDLADWLPLLRSQKAGVRGTSSLTIARVVNSGRPGFRYQGQVWRAHGSA